MLFWGNLYNLHRVKGNTERRMSVKLVTSGLKHQGTAAGSET